MDVRLAWTDCEEAGDYVVSNVLSQRDLVSMPNNMDETVLHTRLTCIWVNLRHAYRINDLDISIREHDGVWRRGCGEHEGERGGQCRGEHQV